jgi:hypothetical protein
MFAAQQELPLAAMRVVALDTALLAVGSMRLLRDEGLAVMALNAQLWRRRFE